MKSSKLLPTARYQPGDYQSSLDGLRALSIIAVLLYHNDGLVPGGYLGVDVFFVLSGFLITSLLLEERRRKGQIDIPRFYLRRALRLFPALGVLLAVGTTFALIFPHAPQSPRVLRGVGYSIVYATNWAQIHDPSFLGPFGHTWSLAVEEQFYLLWPLLLVLLLKWVRSRFALGAILFCLALSSATWRYWLFTHGSTVWRLYNGTDTRADSLLIGCATAVVMTNSRMLLAGSHGFFKYLAAASGALIVLLMRATPLEWPGYDRGMFLIVALAAGMVIYALLTNLDWSITRALSVGPLVWLGRLSYSLYLWHLPIYGFIKPDRLGISVTSARVDRMIVAFAAAVVSYHFVERPFLRLRRRGEKTEKVVGPS